MRTCKRQQFFSLYSLELFQRFQIHTVAQETHGKHSSERQRLFRFYFVTSLGCSVGMRLHQDEHSIKVQSKTELRIERVFNSH